VHFVTEAIDSDSSAVEKLGRSLLDFVLYPTFPRHEQLDQDDLQPSIEMVRLLLTQGASPNRGAEAPGLTSVWELFLLDVQRGLRTKSVAWPLAQQFLHYGAEVDFDVVVSEHNKPMARATGK